MGGHLKVLRDTMPHGEWTAGAEKYTGRSRVQAKKYIRLFENWPTILPWYQADPDLGLSEALTRLDKIGQELLKVLEAIEPGTTPKEILEQTACFVFRDGEVMSFNDAVACWCPSGLDRNIAGAVQAKPLLKLLRELKAEKVVVQKEAGKLVIVGDDIRAELNMEPQIMLKIKSVERPQKWQPLPENFAEAVRLVHPYASKQGSRFAITCVHFTPQWVEACDLFHMARYRIELPIAKPLLVPAGTIRRVIDHNMTEFSQTPNWLHFRNEDGLRISCRCEPDTSDFPELTDYFADESGDAITLPPALTQAAARALVFTSENADADDILLTFTRDSLSVHGIGQSGEYQETCKAKGYKGPERQAVVKPQLLAQLVGRSSVCKVTNEFLRTDADAFTYLTRLGEPGEDRDEGEDRAEQKEPGAGTEEE